MSGRKVSAYNRLHCESVNSEGAACGARPIAGERNCFFHDPHKSVERRAAQSRGGRGNRRSSSDLLSINSAQLDDTDFYNLLSDGLLQGKISPETARAAGYLRKLGTRSKSGDLAARLRAAAENIHELQKNRAGRDSDDDEGF